MSVVIVFCCQIEVSATVRSLVQRSHTDCGLPLCVIQKPREGGDPGLRWAVGPEGGKISKEEAFAHLKSTYSLSRGALMAVYVPCLVIILPGVEGNGLA